MRGLCQFAARYISDEALARPLYVAIAVAHRNGERQGGKHLGIGIVKTFGRLKKEFLISALGGEHSEAHKRNYSKHGYTLRKRQLRLDEKCDDGERRCTDRRKADQQAVVPKTFESHLYLHNNRQHHGAPLGLLIDKVRNSVPQLAFYGAYIVYIGIIAIFK